MDISASNLAIILLMAAFPIYMILTLLNINLFKKKTYFSANDFLIIFKQIKFYIYTMFSSEINSRGITLVVLYFVDANIAASYRVLSQLASAVGIAANSVLFVLRPTMSASDWKVGNRLSETYYFEVWKKYGLAALSSLVCIWPLYILFIADLVETGSGDSAWLLAFLLVLGVSNVIFGPTFIFTGVWAPENRVDIFNLVLKLISLAIATISGYVLGSIYVILSIFILGQLIVQFVAFKKLKELFWKVNV